MDEIKKKVDESWKEQAAKEKVAPKDHKEELPIPEANFDFFIRTLALQASISMGLIENPATNTKEENMPQAKFIIDTIGMLQEKTKNNLSKEEADTLEDIIYALRMQYLEKGKIGGNS
ncbi:MAG TPA: DUF1844 domain-containing protein [Candidatus Omnitrophota bacterium]|nr:DUF1844 domain-containing protein [Candidatus Omnitrophota bacterium]HPT07623.1 DUF1844 domain-containing protein [Candidatus Omnitrophota bacterium]